jgi:hypothetical protein
MIFKEENKKGTPEGIPFKSKNQQQQIVTS